MKKIIASIIAGIVLGSTSVGIAASQNYWKNGGKTYTCTGSTVSVFCKETNWKTGYEVAIMPSRIAVYFGSNPVFACNRKQTPQFNCESFVQGP